jgi:hypothetical protein
MVPLLVLAEAVMVMVEFVSRFSPWVGDVTEAVT